MVLVFLVLLLIGNSSHAIQKGSIRNEIISVPIYRKINNDDESLNSNWSRINDGIGVHGELSFLRPTYLYREDILAKTGLVIYSNTNIIVEYERLRFHIEHYFSKNFRTNLGGLFTPVEKSDIQSFILRENSLSIGYYLFEKRVKGIFGAIGVSSISIDEEFQDRPPFETLYRKPNTSNTNLQLYQNNAFRTGTI